MPQIQQAHIISHTHWDREWYLNSRYTNEWLVPFFDSLFEMLDKEPRYRFVLDGQTSMIEDGCEQMERQGRDVDAFKKRLAGYVSAGRLLVGPYYLQPDWQLVSEEALVRNLLIGRQMARELGGGMQVGWLLDNFGQISQAPQVHDEFGLKGLYLWRGVELEPHRIQSEFLWESPDHTQVVCIYLVGSYRNAMRLAEYPDLMRDRIREEVDKLAPFATTPNVLLMNGYDQELAPDDILPLIDKGAMDFDGVRVVQSTPGEYLAAVTRHAPALQNLHGALYSGRYISVFPGILSSRMYLKTENDRCQRQLEKYAEPLATVAWLCGEPYPAERLDQAWRLLLKSQPHDSICGVSIDDVHTDMEKRFEACRTLTEEIVRATLSTWAAQMDTTRYPEALARWVIVNSAPKERHGVVSIPAHLPPGTTIVDEGGRPNPFQSAPDHLLLFVPDLPAMGYKVLYVVPEIETRRGTVSVGADNGLVCHPEDRTIENEFIKVKIHPDGSLSLTDKIRQVTYPNVGTFEDGADAGDEYNYSPPRRDRIITTRGAPAVVQFVETGPIRAGVRIESILALPESLAADGRRSVRVRPLPIVTWLIVEAHAPVCKFHTEVRNTVKDHRLRVLFPTGIRTDLSNAEAQFDVVQHPIDPPGYDDSTLPDNVKQILLGAREPEPTTIFPQRSFVDLDDGGRGLAVLNRGLPEYQVLKQDRAIALTLFRSVGWIARSDLATRIGDAGPMIATPEAQCLRTMEFDYAIFPHAGNWETGRVSAMADQFNTDFLAFATDSHTGMLEDAGAFLSLRDPEDRLKVTAVKRSEDGQALIVRLHNPTTAAAHAHLISSFNIHRAAFITLGEEHRADLAVEDGHRVAVFAPPKKIVTVRLEIERLTLSTPAEASPVSLFEEKRKESDFRPYEPVVSISPVDIEKEEQRAAQLERALTDKQRLLEQHWNAYAGTTAASARLEWSRLQLQVATCQRAFWEARLSATLLRKKQLETSAGADPQGTEEIARIESEIRKIGLVLNQTRVNKRAYEYIVDCLQRGLNRPGPSGAGP